ncbi:MAG: heterodisulfide reductase [Sulfurospirillaceae bacterium]|nr:heterodisulfide reductase [Sulfurospirillaceae bacterium]
MKQYFLFDALIDTQKSAPLAIAARTLIDFLKINAIPFKGAKADIGSEILSLNAIKFFYTNAFTISLASKESRDILCIENSSFTSLSMTKDALNNDEDLKSIIARQLKHDGIELNLDASIVTLEHVLIEEIGAQKLKTLVQHSFKKFNVALYLGTSVCQARKFTDVTLSEQLLDLAGVKRIRYASAYESDGYEILDHAPQIAKKLASDILLDMFDNAADFVLISDARSFMIFDLYQKELEKIAQRDIELSVLSLPQLLLLAFGVVDKKSTGLDLHRVSITMI